MCMVTKGVVVLKKIVYVLLIVLCSLSMLSLMRSKISASGQSRILYVNADGSTEFLTIQEAVSNASSGDIIFVYKGTYNESVEVDRSVSLVGEDRDSTVIDGQNPQFVINVTADDVSITGFTIKKSFANASSVGIRVSSNGNMISHSKVEGTYEGIILNGATDNFVSDNVISGNFADGISLYFSNKNVFSRNAILNNYEGVSLYKSDNNTFSDNMISGNREGVSLLSSGNNVFSGNTFVNNQDGGTISFYSNHNAFYDNNFHDVIKIESGVANIWNYAGEGNYWRDYTGQDSNKDGIGNTPYSIDANNRDNNPLMGMYSGFDAVLTGETYRVSIISNSTISDFRFEIGAETGNKMVRFNVTGQDGSIGFSRVAIPTRLMKNYSLIVFGGGEEEINSTLLDISTSANMFLYLTYPTYFHVSQTVAIIYSDLLDENLKLQTDLSNLNTTYLDLLSNYTALLNRYNQLQQNYLGLNTSYSEHLVTYQENLENFRNLTYIFAAATAVFIITTFYLSRRLHVPTPKAFEDKK